MKRLFFICHRQNYTGEPLSNTNWAACLKLFPFPFQNDSYYRPVHCLIIRTKFKCGTYANSREYLSFWVPMNNKFAVGRFRKQWWCSKSKKHAVFQMDEKCYYSEIYFISIYCDTRYLILRLFTLSMLLVVENFNVLCERYLPSYYASCIITHQTPQSHLHNLGILRASGILKP